MGNEEKIEILEVASYTGFLDDIRNFVINIAQHFQFKEEDIDDIEFAVDEAVANIIEHAYEGKPGNITIKVVCNDEKFSIEIFDNGKQFDPTKSKIPDLDEHHKEKKTGGLGIYIMTKLMDKINYQFIEGKGNYLSMEKYKKN